MSPKPCSTVIAAPRLCLVELNSFGNAQNRVYCSGNGHLAEFYSICEHENTPNADLLHLVAQMDAFPESKVNVHGIFPIRGEKGDSVDLFCFGEGECAIFCQQPDGWKKRADWHFNDWIIAAQPILGGKQLAVHSATNSVHLLCLRTICTQQSVQLACRALVTASLLDGHDWESLQVFAGTYFGEINLFRPANGDQILRTFAGNKGMPFALRSVPTWLFSVGDDRSLRVWSHRSGEQLHAKFGHGARPFAVEVSIQHRLVFSAGTDTYVCMWRWTTETQPDGEEQMAQLALLRQIDLCSGALGTVRSLLLVCSGERPSLLVASERGALVRVSLPILSTQLPKQSSSSSFPYNKVLAFAFAQIGRSEVILALDDNRHFCVASAADNVMLEKLSERINCALSASSANGADRRLQFRTDLFRYSESANTLALCSNDNSTLYLIQCGQQFERLQPNPHSVAQSVDDILEFNVVGMDRSFEQILWANSHEAPHLLFCVDKTGNEAVIYQVHNNNNTDPWPSPSTVFSFRQPSAVPFPRIQSALWIQGGTAQTGVLLLGTRSGSLLGYSRHSVLRFSSDPPSVSLFQCVLVQREAHRTCGSAGDTVTALQLESSISGRDRRVEGQLRTLGRDGVERRWHFRLGESAESFSLRLISVRALPMEWPCEFFRSPCGLSLIGGFHADDFVLLDEGTGTILCRHRCGGGNRRWQLRTASAAEQQQQHQFRFIYTQKCELNCVQLCPLRVQFVQPPLHSNNIVALALPRSLSPSPGPIILSGGLDRRLECHWLSAQTKGGGTTTTVLDSAQVHKTSVEGLCVVPQWSWPADAEESGQLVLSVGGRSEVCGWRLVLDAAQDITGRLDFLFFAQLSDEAVARPNEDQMDIRVMSVHHLSANAFATLCSDGTIRLLDIECSVASRKWTVSTRSLWRIPSLAMLTAMCVPSSNSDAPLLFATSSAGHLHSFRTGGTLEECAAPFLVERCGLSCLCCLPPLASDTVLCFVGSESGSLSVLKCRRSVLELTTRVEWHSATVTAIQSFCCTVIPSSPVNVFSISLDCRLTIGQFEKDQLFSLRQVSLAVRDPAALLISPVPQRDNDGKESNRFDCFVSGAGLECVHM